MIPYRESKYVEHAKVRYTRTRWERFALYESDWVDLAGWAVVTLGGAALTASSWWGAVTMPALTFVVLYRILVKRRRKP